MRSFPIRPRFLNDRYRSNQSPFSPLISRSLKQLPIGLALVATILLYTLNSFAQPTITLVIDNQTMGISTQYIGAVEGNVNFDLNDLQDLGINTYRIYGGMSRWEYEDDDGVYGLPSIAEIKADPTRVNWNWWDEVMTNPPHGSDYWWSGSPDEIWQGNARELFNTLKQANIRPVLTIRNVDNSWKPDWALQLNPPRTEADWNEWWEHVFATVYWLNVRNNYQVDDFEIHNEPDYRSQGWGGTQNDYFELVRVAKDAIDHVYQSYLPGRNYHIHAPATIGDSRWVLDAIQTIPEYFDSINIHNYAENITRYTQTVRDWLRDTIRANSPIWLGEWGTYQSGYEDLTFSLNVLQNIMRASQPGDSYIYGSHIFCLYDWGKSNEFKALIGANGERRLSYYALRMGIRALQGGRSILPILDSGSNLFTLASKDESGAVNLLIVNRSDTSPFIKVDVSTIMRSGDLTIWQLSETIKDEIINRSTLQQGHIQVEIPPLSGILVQAVPSS
jgi:hypothetical protein